MPKSSRLAVPTISTTGPIVAKVAMTIRLRRATAPGAWLDSKISMITGTGALIPNTVQFGFRVSNQAGLLITMDTGPGSILGDGRGSTTPAGATRHFTTAAGYRSKDVGVGFPDRGRSALFMHRLWWPSSAAVLEREEP